MGKGYSGVVIIMFFIVLGILLIMVMGEIARLGVL